MAWKFILSLLFAIIIAIFAMQNSETVDVKFFFMTLSISQALVILISAILGSVIVMMLSIIRWAKLGSIIRNSTKTITALEEENKQLKQKLEKSIPVSTEIADINKPLQDSVQSLDELT